MWLKSHTIQAISPVAMTNFPKGICSQLYFIFAYLFNNGNYFIYVSQIFHKGFLYIFSFNGIVFLAQTNIFSATHT